MVEIFLPGKFLEGIPLRPELVEFAVHLGDFLLVELDLPALIVQGDARADHPADIVGIDKTDPYQEYETDQEILIQKYFPDTVLFPFPVLFPDFREDGHGGGCFHKNNDYF